jgi:hypothetical protein
MHQHFVQQVARLGVAVALTASALAAQATVIDNSVRVGPRSTSVYPPSVYGQGYTVGLGTGSWPYPYVDLYVDVAAGKSSYANIAAGPSYLTYIQNVNIVQVKAGDEISARTLTDGSLPSFVKVTAYAPPQGQNFEVNPLTSSTGSNPDIYLGFSYSDQRGLNPAYGWAHLRYTQADGLSLVSSAMTTSDAGIFALTRNTIAAVPEASTTAMLGLGLSGIVGLASARRRQQASRGLAQA